MGKYRSRGKRTTTKNHKHTRILWTGVEREVKRKEHDAANAADKLASTGGSEDPEPSGAPATSSSSTTSGAAAAAAAAGATVGIQSSTGVGTAEATGADGQQ
jgi:hypothetical protein